MTLYEINKELEAVYESAFDAETGEMDMAAEQALNDLQMARDEKIENIALMIKNLQADADAIKAEAQKQAKRAKICENKANWLKAYLFSVLNGEKYKSAKCEITYRKSKNVECTVDDVSTLDPRFLRYSLPELNKTELKKALEAGEAVAGCALVEKYNIQIK